MKIRYVTSHIGWHENQYALPAAEIALNKLTVKRTAKPSHSSAMAKKSACAWRVMTRPSAPSLIAAWRPTACATSPKAARIAIATNKTGTAEASAPCAHWMPSDDEIRKILKDPGMSSWFKLALSTALNRDPVDAAADADLLAIVLARRADQINNTARAALDARYLIQRAQNKSA